MPFQAPFNTEFRVKSKFRFTAEPLLRFRRCWYSVPTSVSNLALAQQLMRLSSYAFDGHRMLHGFVRETLTLQFIGEWSAEVLEFIPYVYALKKRNMLTAKISTYSGMRP